MSLRRNSSATPPSEPASTGRRVSELTATFVGTNKANGVYAPVLPLQQMRPRLLRLFTLMLICGTTSPLAHANEPPSFGRDVLPILSANCFACHGPDPEHRQADLRLDREDDAHREYTDGTPIVPGKPDQSSLIKRITSSDPDVVMPPPDSHKSLTREQIAILQRWIAAGAKWGRHWSFEPVVKPQLPPSSSSQPIDELVRRRLAQHGLSLSPTAPPHQLVRRLSLDLLGLPPTPQQIERFTANPTAEAYEKMVDEYLESPQFGEHWARMWLDLARYADTKGYEKDLGRTVWPYRDWVVQALNADMPLDQFTREQLAGDLLPSPTPDQLLATTFHRLTMSNDEGGTDDEEFRVAAVKDRVDTTLQVWMGLTAGCAKCHSHKYDPLSQAEYYSLFAIFNQTADADRYDDSPTHEFATSEQLAERSRLQTQLTQLQTDLKAADEAAVASENAHWRVLQVESAVSSQGATLEPQSDGAIRASGKDVQQDDYILTVLVPAGRITALRLEALPSAFADGQLGLGRNAADPNFVVSELQMEQLTGDSDQPLPWLNALADFSQDNWPVQAAIDGDLKTGWAVSPRSRERHVAYFTLASPLQLNSDTKLRVSLRQHYGNGLVLQRFRLAFSDLDSAAIAVPAATPEQQAIKDKIAATQQAVDKLNTSIVQVPIMRELTSDSSRTTRIHQRGNFLDPGAQVAPAVPAAFHQLPAEHTINRRALADWLVHPENPLTPRVWANRIWSRLFGRGIVETEEDFGALGAAPSHPELLDWLAAEYRDNSWSLKKLLKSIVLSETYRQSSVVTPDRQALDPNNMLLSRGARYRHPAETIRDQALAVSGLLSLKMGGPPVMPPQPAGLWRSTYNGQTWVNAEGEDRYRRALYTYLKRTTPYPSMITFDGGSGEVCQIRRIRTNTPLQALVTLNDPVFLEAAAALAQKMVQAGEDAQQRVTAGLQLALGRPVQPAEAEPLLALQVDVQAEFQQSPASATELLAATRAQPPAEAAKPEFAAWIVVANAILNLDEFLTRN